MAALSDPAGNAEQPSPLFCRVAASMTGSGGGVRCGAVAQNRANVLQAGRDAGATDMNRLVQAMRIEGGAHGDGGRHCAGGVDGAQGVRPRAQVAAVIAGRDDYYDAGVHRVIDGLRVDVAGGGGDAVGAAIGVDIEWAP